MTVYVDDMHRTELGNLGRMKMCHMIADTDEELHAMADKIGIARKWHQKPPKASSSHYDICTSKRTLAVHAGAVEITLRQAAMMCRNRRRFGTLGTPPCISQDP